MYFSRAFTASNFSISLQYLTISPIVGSVFGLITLGLSKYMIDLLLTVANPLVLEYEDSELSAPVLGANTA